MADERHDEGKGFTVRDRRGEEDAPAEPAAVSGGEPTSTPTASPLPAIDFSTFVLSLSTSALVLLGEAPDPEGNRQRDLPLARQTIDILGILEEKTRGNLTDDEQRLLADVLYDLRLRFVSTSA
ncbi:MAG: DUF1844 domain-containing protein [Deltaproteobacteria bacterium]|nr:DUF1844 domain-containing protein [Deltaproteobacteria bacterium]